MSPKMLISKAKQSDIESLEKMLELLENIFNGSGLDDSPLFKKIWKERGLSDKLNKDDCDSIYLEMIRRHFRACSGRWIKVLNTADVMINQLCSKDVSYIELEPFIKRAVENSMLGE